MSDTTARSSSAGGAPSAIGAAVAVERGYFIAVKNRLSRDNLYALQFQFNPESIEDNKAVRYQATRAGGAATRSFQGEGDRVIRFTLHLHAERAPDDPVGESRSLEGDLAMLRGFILANYTAEELDRGKRGKMLRSPPLCEFTFGSRAMLCQMTELKVTERAFDRFLRPIRVDAEVTLHVLDDLEESLATTERKRGIALRRRDANTPLETHVVSGKPAKRATPLGEIK